jgi:cytidylate kinase
MYRALAWYCLKEGIDTQDAKAVAAACRRWKTTLECVDGQVQLAVQGYYPAREIRTPEVSAAVALVAAVPQVRQWMKRTQRECVQFGNLVMEGRDIGSNVFPETDFKYYLDASLEERLRRRAADGIRENLAARDQRDSQRSVAPLMIPLGAVVINNSRMSAEQTGAAILADVRRKLVQHGTAGRAGGAAPAEDPPKPARQGS